MKHFCSNQIRLSSSYSLDVHSSLEIVSSDILIHPLLGCLIVDHVSKHIVWNGYHHLDPRTSQRVHGGSISIKNLNLPDPIILQELHDDLWRQRVCSHRPPVHSKAISPRTTYSNNDETYGDLVSWHTFSHGEISKHKISWSRGF